MTKDSSSISNADLVFDAKHIWHPYSSMREPLPVYPIVSAEGVRLRLADGRLLVDGMSSWWAAIHGYNHPELNAAANQQISAMSHVMFGGVTHKPAIDLARLLLEISPTNLTKVFFSDSGSVAVEIAIKMALQFWHALGEPSKSKLLTIRSGYHGDTFQAMSVCDPITGMHEIFSNTLPKQFFAPAPQCNFDEQWNDSDLAAMEKIIRSHHQEIAAVILEPIVQGAGGMHFYHPNYLKGVRQLCDQHNILLIADEIATGFGRTGKMFACEHADVQPDILCLGKALTGGYISLAATLANDRVSDAIADGRDNGGIMMHGPTYMANPLACSIAIASTELLMNSPWVERISHIESVLGKLFTPIAAFSRVRSVRVFGAIGVVELHEPVDVALAQRAFVDRGAWIRPFGRLIYLMPPYIIDDEDLALLVNAIESYLSCT